MKRLTSFLQHALKYLVNICLSPKFILKVSHDQMEIFHNNSGYEWANPLMLTAAKTSLTILINSYGQKHSKQNN